MGGSAAGGRGAVEERVVHSIHKKKMCPSVAWHRARFARPFQTHGCGEALRAVPITDQPACSVQLGALPMRSLL